MYVLDAYQGKGLGTWLIKAVDETLVAWPELRRMLLVTSEGNAIYEKLLGMRRFEEEGKGLVVYSKRGRGTVMKD